MATFLHTCYRIGEIDRSVAFYRDVLGAEIHYRDIDFAAVRFGPAEVMLHADHTHDTLDATARFVADARCVVRRGGLDRPAGPGHRRSAGRPGLRAGLDNPRAARAGTAGRLPTVDSTDFLVGCCPLV